MFAVSDLSCNSGLYLLLDTLNDWLIWLIIIIIIIVIIIIIPSINKTKFDDAIKSRKVGLHLSQTSLRLYWFVFVWPALIG